MNMSNSVKIVLEKSTDIQSDKIMRFCKLNNISLHTLTVFAEFLELGEHLSIEDLNEHNQEILDLSHSLEKINLDLRKKTH